MLNLYVEVISEEDSIDLQASIRDFCERTLNPVGLCSVLDISDESAAAEQINPGHFALIVSIPGSQATADCVLSHLVEFGMELSENEELAEVTAYVEEQA